jgi:hypothetical protein
MTLVSRVLDPPEHPGSVAGAHHPNGMTSGAPRFPWRNELRDRLGDGIGSQQRNHAPGDQDKANHADADHGGGATFATHPGSKPGDPVLR